MLLSRTPFAWMISTNLRRFLLVVQTAIEQRFSVTANRGQRSPEFVRHVGDKVALHPLQALLRRDIVQNRQCPARCGVHQGRGVDLKRVSPPAPSVAAAAAQSRPFPAPVSAHATVPARAPCGLTAHPPRRCDLPPPRGKRWVAERHIQLGIHRQHGFGHAASTASRRVRSRFRRLSRSAVRAVPRVSDRANSPTSSSLADRRALPLPHPANRR